MNVEVAGRVLSTLPADDDHPYRTGAWRPNFVEYDATDLDVVGEIPDDLDGVYLRNTENPVHPSIDRLYHPFDGDGMLHMIRFHDGRADYRNRFVRTVGFEAEQEAGHALWSGILGAPEQSLRDDGWGARTRMKDASSTDVVVHAGRALTSFYQCGDLYALRSRARSSSSAARRGTASSPPTGASPRTRSPTRAPARCSCSTTRRPRRSCTTESSTPTTSSCTGSTFRCPARACRTTWRSPSTTRSSTTARCSGTPTCSRKGAHVPRFRPDLPTRFAVIPRRGATADIRWFEAEPTYVLHWANAYEDGDEIVLDGFFQGDPMPAAGGETDPYRRAFRGIDTHRMQTTLKRWRMNLTTGACKEETVSERIMEFPMINPRYAGRPYRYAYNMTTQPGWFLFDGVVKVDLQTGAEERYAFGEGVFGSETPMAPRARRATATRTTATS